MQEPGNRVMYYLKDGPEHAFVQEELMLIPEKHRAASRICKRLVSAFQRDVSPLKNKKKPLVGP